MYFSVYFNGFIVLEKLKKIPKSKISISKMPKTDIYFLFGFKSFEASLGFNVFPPFYNKC